MSEYKITVDSTCDLTNEYLKENDIPYTSLKYILDDDEYADNLFQDVKPADFYAKLEAGSMATTSQVNVTDYVALWEPMLKDGLDVLQFSFSSGLSGSANSAFVAAEQLREQYPDRKIVVVDSVAACGGYGLLVTYAADMKKDGKSIEEVSEWLEANKLKLQHIFTVDSLAHLKRGGRISGAAAAIGSMIQVKPMLHLDAEGKIKAGDKAKGRKKSLLMLVDYMGDNGVDLAGQRIIISHADCADDAAFIEKKIKERHPDVGEVLIGNVGPVIGAHSGPGTAALFFLGKERA